MILARLALIALLSVSVVCAFAPSRVARARSSIDMATENPSASKLIGAALMASTMFSMPVFAKDGTGAKLSFFGDKTASSPFTVSENREDSIYSPYSPYGDGGAAVYQKGGKEEVGFYATVLKNSVDRTKKIPGYIAKKTWTEVTTELTRYNYNMREAMLRLAEASKDPKEANAAAKAYFSDINDIYEWSSKKNQGLANAAYEKSVKDLSAFEALVK